MNVPAATYNLMHGLEGAREPESEDYITKQTTCAPGEAGKQLWLDALDTFFCKDQTLIDSLIGLPVPKKLKEVLEQLQDKADEEEE